MQTQRCLVTSANFYFFCRNPSCASMRCLSTATSLKLPFSRPPLAAFYSKAAVCRLAPLCRAFHGVKALQNGTSPPSGFGDPARIRDCTETRLPELIASPSLEMATRRSKPIVWRLTGRLESEKGVNARSETAQNGRHQHTFSDQQRTASRRGHLRT